MYLFMDESGCLGFDFNKKKTSKYFVITCMFIEVKGPLEKLIKKINKEFRRGGLNTSGVLHCSKEKPATRKKLLNLVNIKECYFMAIYLN